LKDELKRVKKGHKKSDFLIEIDQKTSGLVITALITGDFELAKHSNLVLFDGEKKDAASYVMNKSADYFSTKSHKNGPISRAALLELSANMGLHKNL
jgi:hypothetical protein